METYTLKVIAHIRTDLPEKFGVPRQSGLIPELKGTIVFEPEYRSMDALRGLEEFSHLWLVWQFSKATREDWSPLVRPPRLGGNEKMGVFATRSPFRPNALGLSSVELEKVEFPAEVLEKVPEKHRDAVRAVLEADPRPRYQDDPQRIYGLTFAAWNIKFRVEGETLYVVEVEKA